MDPIHVNSDRVSLSLDTYLGHATTVS